MFKNIIAFISLAGAFVQCKNLPIAKYSELSETIPKMNPVCIAILQINMDAALNDYNMETVACTEKSAARKADIEPADFPESRAKVQTAYVEATILACDNGLDLERFLQCYLDAV